MSKTRKIEFHSLAIQSTERDSDPVYDFEPTAITSVLEYISSIPTMKNRFSDAEGKRMYLSTADGTYDPDGKLLYQKLIFISFKPHYRPDLIDGVSGAERGNPKKSTEGEKSKTHIVLKYTEGEGTLVCIERNRQKGVTIGYIVEYLNRFLRESGEENYKFTFSTLVITNFLDALNKFTVLYEGQLEVTKKILGSEYLNLTERTRSIKENLKIEMKPESKRVNNLKESALDVYDNMTSGGSIVTRMTLRGHSTEGDNITIDTSTLEKTMSVEAQVNEDTGEVESSSIFTEIIRKMPE
jgi:hypothetical protein